MSWCQYNAAIYRVKYDQVSDRHFGRLLSTDPIAQLLCASRLSKCHGTYAYHEPDIRGVHEHDLPSWQHHPLMGRFPTVFILSSLRFPLGNGSLRPSKSFNIFGLGSLWLFLTRCYSAVHWNTGRCLWCYGHGLLVPDFPRDWLPTNTVVLSVRGHNNSHPVQRTSNC